MWIEHSKDNKIPDWLKNNIDAECPECGSPMMNFYSTKDKERCTNRKCSNNSCPLTIATRISEMTDILKIPNIGVATGLTITRNRELTNHLQALEYISDQPISMSINTLLRIAFIPSMGTKCFDIDTREYTSMRDFLEKYRGEHYYTIMPYANLLLEGESKVNISTYQKPHEIEFDCVYSCNVMITGNVLGLGDRKLFPHYINLLTKGLVEVKVVGKRKTGVTALIAEQGYTVTGKVSTAVENNIPIMTSEEFVEYVFKRIEERL